MENIRKKHDGLSFFEKKGLDIAGMDFSFLDIFLSCKEENKVISGNIDLRTGMVFQTVEKGIVSVAISNFHRSIAKDVLFDFINPIEGVHLRLIPNINIFFFRHDGIVSKIGNDIRRIQGKEFSVFLKFFIRDTSYFHR